ncbi:hypothetical protein OAT16_07975 [Prolixibacteraceae bacterium]|nr:hypothetical protein [Prolixibacteraceae bacterium]
MKNARQSEYATEDITALIRIIRDNRDVFLSEKRGQEILGWNAKDCAYWDNVIWTNRSPKRVEGLNLSGLSIQTADLSSFDSLKHLDLSHNRIVTITFPRHLEMINISNNVLTEIDCTSLSNLESLVASRNKMNKIKLPSDSKLKLLNISENKLKKLDLNQQHELKRVNFSSNQLLEVDLSDNHHLDVIKGRWNYLETIWMPSGLMNPFPNIEIKNNEKCKNGFPKISLKQDPKSPLEKQQTCKNTTQMVDIINAIISFRMPNKDSVVLSNDRHKIYIF